MVSRKQHVLNVRGALWVAALSAVGAFAPIQAAEVASKRFYPDDPLWREPAPRPVRQIAVRQVDDIYDFLENSYVTGGREGKAAKHSPRPAQDINTLGEVPDSTWYTNRHGFRRMSIAELQRGPGNETPPSSRGGWKIVGAKSDGVTPGFVIEDSNAHRYLFKFDPPDFPELCSAADVIGSKFFYALGFFTPENYIVRFYRENLAISPGTTWRDANGRKRLLTAQAVDELLKSQPKTGGAYRAVASRLVEGRVIGPFSYRGTRSDDPNDTIPHEDRRVLRGLRVFAAWLNHQDTRSINSMDTLVTENGRQYVKHYLIDFGSILGSAGYARKEPWMGHQYFISRPDAAMQTVTFGFYVPKWMRSKYPNYTGTGLLDSWSFDPLDWKPNYPNPAFLMMDRADAFWAAKQVTAFTDDEIRALVRIGEFTDPRATEWVAKCLIERRDKIAAVWFKNVLPLHNFRVGDGKLSFDDAGAKSESAPRRAYTVRWAGFDNDRRAAVPLSAASGTTIPFNDHGFDYLAATITCSSVAEGPCPNPVVVYLRRTDARFEVVGIDR